MYRLAQMMKYFSESYLESIYSIKSEEYCNRLEHNLALLNESLNDEDREAVCNALEEQVHMKPKGNYMAYHNFGTFGDLENKAVFIQNIIEDIWDWFMGDPMLLDCRLFLFCVHLDEFQFTDEVTDKLIFAIMTNFIEKGLPCPDVVLCMDEENQAEWGNGYRILGLK